MPQRHRCASRLWAYRKRSHSRRRVWLRKPNRFSGNKSCSRNRRCVNKFRFRKGRRRRGFAPPRCRRPVSADIKGNAMDRMMTSKSLMGSLGLLLILCLGACQTSQPEWQAQATPTCPPGTLLTTDMQCAKRRPAKPVEVDNRPIPYDPQKVDTSPIRVN